MDRGVWWARVHAVAKSWTRLKRLIRHAGFTEETRTLKLKTKTKTRNANRNHYEVPFHTSQNGCDPKVYK